MSSFPDASLFELDSGSGRLSLRRAIPPAAAGVIHRLTVRATDEAIQSQRKQADTSLTLFGVGAGGPTFAQRYYSGSVAENEPPGTVVLTVGARYSDVRTTMDIEYYITGIRDETGAAVERVFEVDPKRGVVQTARVLDRENGGALSYEITLHAVSPGAPTPQTQEAKVRVPEVLFFSKEYIGENQRQKT